MASVSSPQGDHRWAIEHQEEHRICIRTPAHCTTEEAVAACFSSAAHHHTPPLRISVRTQRGQRDPITGLRGGVAFVAFPGAAAAEEALARYDGSAGEATMEYRSRAPALARGRPLSGAAARRGWEPSVWSQLRPLSLAQLQERAGQLRVLDGEEDTVAAAATAAADLQAELDVAIAQHGVVAGHELLLAHLTARYGQQRPKRWARGAYIAPGLCTALLAALRATEWGPKERQLSADGYITVRVALPRDGKKAARKCERLLREHAKVWQAAARLFESVGPKGYAYTSLALTRNFRGSPHRDELDQSFQFAVSLGTFGDCGGGGGGGGDGGGAADCGGRLCTESSVGEVTCIDTHNKLGCIDGRCTHWVDGYEGERFSVVFYTVDEAHFTPAGHALPLPEYAVFEEFAPQQQQQQQQQQQRQQQQSGPSERPPPALLQPAPLHCVAP